MNTRTSIRDPNSLLSTEKSQLRASPSEVMYDLSLMKSPSSTNLSVNKPIHNSFSENEIFSAVLGFASLIFEAEVTSALSRMSKTTQQRRHQKCRIPANSQKKSKENARSSKKPPPFLVIQTRQSVNGFRMQFSSKKFASQPMGSSGFRSATHLLITQFISRAKCLTDNGI